MGVNVFRVCFARRLRPSHLCVLTAQGAPLSYRESPSLTTSFYPSIHGVFMVPDVAPSVESTASDDVGRTFMASLDTIMMTLGFVKPS